MSIINNAKLKAYKIAEQSFEENADCSTIVNTRAVKAMSKERYIKIVSAFMLNQVLKSDEDNH